MIVDSKQIIDDTLKVFYSSEAQRKKFSSLTDVVDQDSYHKLHPRFLTPLDIKIDCKLFEKEIAELSAWFEQWGTEHTHLPRYGLALVNQDGQLKEKDPINGSLYEWNSRYPDNPILETDCQQSTSVLNISSLAPLRLFDGHWTRSNILKWGQGAEFKPHIDAIIPSPWIRLWGTTDTNLKIRSANVLTGEMVAEEQVEAGRIYIIDTSLVHDAVNYGNTAYQFFLSVKPTAVDLLNKLIL